MSPRPTLSRAAGLRDSAAWLVFAIAVVLATKPVWSLWIFGFEPSLDMLLTLRCF